MGIELPDGITIEQAAIQTWHRVAEIYDADGYDGAAAAIRERAPMELGEAKRGDREMWFAMHDDRVVGTVGLALRGKDAGLADGVTSANINRLHVVQAWRKRGIASALMAAAEQRAAEMGMGALTIEVEADNAPARRLYEKLGFAYTGRSSSAENVGMGKGIHSGDVG